MYQQCVICVCNKHIDTRERCILRRIPIIAYISFEWRISRPTITMCHDLLNSSATYFHFRKKMTSA
jgi:hypothetical protein